MGEGGVGLSLFEAEREESMRPLCSFVADPICVNSCAFVVAVSASSRRRLQAQLLKPVVHFFEMEVERAEGFEFALFEMFRHDHAGFSFPQCAATRL